MCVVYYLGLGRVGRAGLAARGGVARALLALEAVAHGARAHLRHTRCYAYTTSLRRYDSLHAQVVAVYDIACTLVFYELLLLSFKVYHDYNFIVGRINSVKLLIHRNQEYGRGK